MKSPKFEFIVNKIEQHLGIQKFKIVWKNKIRLQLRKQAYMDLIEYRDIDKNIEKFVQILLKEIKEAQYYPKKPRQYLVEKSRGMCRQMTLAQPRDILLLQVLINIIYGDIKKNQPTDKAFFEPGNMKFNQNKFLIDTDSYGAIASWKRFQQAILDFSKERKFVVVTDVANFYDFINYNHLRNIISSNCEVDEYALDLLMYVLERLAWAPDYMPHSRIGLPQMEIEAPRVLANAMLFEVDSVAMKKSYGDYARFMDDIDLGVDSINEAKRAVRDIDLTLQSRQLRLNSSKTKILSSNNGEVDHHYCTKENNILEMIGKYLENGAVSKSTLSRCLIRCYDLWRNGKNNIPFSDKCRFFTGNGEKLFNRMMRMMIRLDAIPPSNHLLYLTIKSPSLREKSLNLLSFTANKNENFYRIKRFYMNGLFIDHKSKIDICKYLLHAKFINNQKFNREMNEFIWHNAIKEGWIGAYVSYNLAIKFFDIKTLYKFILQNMDKFKDDYWIGRIIGSISSRFVGNSYYFPRYKKIIISHGIFSATDTLQYIEDISKGNVILDPAYVNSGNPSFSQNIFMPKLVILRSYMHYGDKKNNFDRLNKKHPSISKDPFFRRWFDITY